MKVSLVRLTAILSLAFVASALVACSKDKPTEAKEFAERGNALFAQAKYREAIIEYRNAVEKDPQLGDAHLKLSEAYEKVGDLKSAMDESIRAADLLPSNGAAQTRAATFLVAAGQFVDAKARANKALEIDPKNFDATIQLGNAMAGLKDTTGAIGELEHAITVNPADARLQVSRGLYEMSRGNKEETEKAFLKAVELRPTSVNAQLSLAYFYWLTGRQAESEATFKRAHALGPNDILANRAMALFYVFANRGPEAEPYVKKVADLTGGPGARLVLANYYLAMQRDAQATDILRTLTSDPQVGAEAKTRLALVESRAGRPAEGQRLLDEVLAADPRNIRALLMKARLLQEAGQLDEAQARITAAIDANPKNAAAQYALGTVYEAKGDVTQASKAFNEALKLNPRAVEARLGLARVFIARATSEQSEALIGEAVATAALAVKEQPDNVDARITLAQALAVKGDLALAETELKTVLSSVPSHLGANAAMGALQLRRGNEDAARESFNRVLKLSPQSFEAFRGMVAADVQEGRLAEARTKVEARMAKEPANPDVLVLAARTYAAEWNPSKIEPVLLKLIEVAPANLEAYSMLGELYVRENKLDEARLQFEALAKRQPNRVGAKTMVGIILYQQGKLPEATAKFEEVVKADRRAAVAANNLASLYADRGSNLDAALEYAKAAREVLPNSPEVADTLGWVYYKKDVPAMAIPLFQESIQRSPKNPYYHYHLGMAYAKTNQADKARQSLRQALTINASFAGADEAKRTLAGLK